MKNSDVIIFICFREGIVVEFLKRVLTVSAEMKDARPASAVTNPIA